MEALVLLLFWLVALLALARGIRALVLLFFAAVPFGSLAMVPPAFTGGLTLTPLSVAAALLVLRIVLSREHAGLLVQSITHPRPQAILAAFWVVALLATLLMPRFFAGEILVVPVRVIEGDLAPLAPSTQNLSQFAYLTISVATTLCVSVALRGRETRSVVPGAILLAALVTIATCLLDYAGERFGLGGLMAAFRTATYALLVDAEVLGARRIVGLMPEASALGSICVVLLSLLYFARNAFARGDRRRLLVLPACAALAGFALASSSSAAYVGLAVFMALALLEWVWRGITGSGHAEGRTRFTGEALVLSGALVAASATLLLAPDIIARVAVVIDDILVDKIGSSSFEERSLWTRTAWEAFFASGGLGVGVGGSRASNFWAALASNTGLLGLVLFAAFMAACYLRRAPWRDPQGAHLLSACRWALPPSLAIGALIGTSADFGALTAFTLGLMLATGRGPARRPHDAPASTLPATGTAGAATG